MKNSFQITPTMGWVRNPHTNVLVSKYFLTTQVEAFYHADYTGGGKWREPGTIENLICTLKNDITPYSDNVLESAQQHLSDILRNDLPEILRCIGLQAITVCVIPRAKAEKTYREDQKLFRATVKNTVSRLNGFIDGTDYIIRHTNTVTTHRAKWGYGGTGDMPYPGITKNTCTISDKVNGSNILLIDDLYTKTINIDEDAIQALLDKGAKSVFFYSIGKTVMK